MSEGKFVLPGSESVSMSGDAARRLIGCGSGDAALLYLYILISGGRYDKADAAARIGRSQTQIETAMGVLSRLGLVSLEEEPVTQIKERPDELPDYTAQDIARELDNGQSFKSLVEEVQKALGKILSSDDLKKLFGIYDYLGLPCEVILQLVIHGREEFRRSRGPGRIPTMRYIEKAAYSWEREGIFSLEAAEGYIAPGRAEGDQKRHGPGHGDILAAPVPVGAAVSGRLGGDGLRTGCHSHSLRQDRAENRRPRLAVHGLHNQKLAQQGAAHGPGDRGGGRPAPEDKGCGKAGRRRSLAHPGGA